MTLEGSGVLKMVVRKSRRATQISDAMRDLKVVGETSCVDS